MRAAAVTCAVALAVCASGVVAARPAQTEGVRGPWRFFLPARTPGAFELRDRHADAVISADGVVLATSRGAVRLRIAGAWSEPRGDDPLDARANDFHGASSASWRRNLPLFGALRSTGRGDAARELRFVPAPDGVKYSVVLPPGQARRRVEVELEGADAAELDPRGLRFSAGDDRFVDGDLKCGQSLPSGALLPIECHFTPPVRTGDERFEYVIEVTATDPNLPVIVDPYFAWSSYVGGATSDVDEALAIDAIPASQNVIVAGDTNTATLAPTGTTPLRAYTAMADGFVLSVNADGTVAWVTFLGGSGSESVHGVSTSGAGTVGLVGITDSSDFPLKAAFDTTQAGSEGFVAVIDDAGALQWSTYLGGGTYDDAESVDLSAGGELAVTGHTTSSTFPLKNAFKTTVDVTNADGYVARFDPTGALEWSTVFGGNSGGEFPFAVRMDAALNTYVVGWTDAPDFPLSGAWASTHPNQGGHEAFAIKVTPGATPALAWSMLLGSTGDDEAHGLAVDPTSGELFVGGSTTSATFPLVGAVDASFGGSSEAWIAQLKSDGTGPVWSTFLGGTGDDFVNGIARDSTGDLYAVGTTTSPDLPALGAPDGVLDGADAFVAKVKGDGSSVLWSTLVGGSANDEGHGITASLADEVWIAGSTQSDATSFPLKNAFDSQFGLPREGFVARLLSDSTPPPAGTVMATSPDSSTVEVSWSGFDDPESGTDSYFVAIGTSPDATDVSGFQSAGSAPSITLSGLTLSPVTPYYATVFARNGAGLSSTHVNSQAFFAGEVITDAGVENDAGINPTDAGQAEDGGASTSDGGTIADGGSGQRSLIGWSCATTPGNDDEVARAFTFVVACILASSRSRSVRRRSRRPS